MLSLKLIYKLINIHYEREFLFVLEPQGNPTLFAASNDFHFIFSNYPRSRFFISSFTSD